MQRLVEYAKPNVAIFNIDIFIQFNPYSFNLIFIFIQFNRRSFNSIPIVILFNPHSFNSIFRSIQFNFCILLIQFQYWFNLISIFIQFNFYIHSIQLLYSFNSISNSFDPIFIFIQFNPSLFIQSSHSFIQFGDLGRGEKFERELGHMVKMADEMLEDEHSEVKNFFEHVIGKAEEILSQNSFARSERHISEVLTHIDLLERTVRLPRQLASIVTDDRN